MNLNRHFKKGKEDKWRGQVHEQQAYLIIEMGDRFPFGALRQIPDESQEILVRKKLYYDVECYEDVLDKTAALLRSLRNDSLVNFHHMERRQGVIYFYYDYAHLTMEKWILDLGDDMLEVLKNQMLQLATFLNHNQIFFIFDQKNMGLSQDIAVKYFLHEFSLMEAKEESMKNKNLSYNREKIGKFFSKFRQTHQQEKDTSLFTSMIVIQQKKCLDSEEMGSSITTRESWTTVPLKTSRTINSRGSKSKTLTERLERSKIKTNEILQKLKKVKNLQF